MFNSLWIKPTDALNSSSSGITTLHVSGSPSAHHQEFLAIYRLWYILRSCDDRLLAGAGWNCRRRPTSNSSQQNFKIVWPCIVTDSLWIRPTDALNSNFISITTLHVSGSLSAHHQEFLFLHRLWYILCSCDDRLIPGAGWNCKFHPAPGSKRS